MILIGLGANLPSPAGPPRATLEAALAALGAAGVRTLSRSRWWRTAPVPISDQPHFVNGVAAVATPLGPKELLSLMRAIELRFGRKRGLRNEARSLDLDLLDYEGRVVDGPELVLPHPRLAARAFVLLPLAEVAPGWRHPKSELSIEALIARLPQDQQAEPIGC